MNDQTDPNVYRISNLSAQVVEIDLDSIDAEELRLFGGVTNAQLRRIVKQIREMGENEEMSDERTANAAAHLVEQYL